MNFSIPRFVRFACICIFFLPIAGTLLFARNQSRFQQCLRSHYITFDDFPPAYTETLRSKDWNSLEQGQFDYARYFPSNDTSSTPETIPLNIHFIWFKDLYTSRPSISEIPSKGSHAPELCRKHNPSYTVTVWNATAGRGLLEEHYAWFLPTYDTYRFPIQRIDALKYFILWHFGGIYLDMDISCRRPLEPLLNFPAWFPEASPLGINNDFMASRTRHPIIAMMLENLAKRNRNFIFPYLTIFWSTGPQFTSDMLKRWFLRHKSNADTTSHDNWFVLPQQFYSEEFSFFGHSPGGTWHCIDVATVLWLVGHPWILGILAMTILSSCLIPMLWRRRRSLRPMEGARNGDTGA